MTVIAIVGAGFSGTLLTLHLLRRCPPPTRLVLIERNSQFGRGLAYSTGNASHILNVPAGRMSAFPRPAKRFSGLAADQRATRGRRSVRAAPGIWSLCAGVVERRNQTFRTRSVGTGARSGTGYRPL